MQVPYFSSPSVLVGRFLIIFGVPLVVGGVLMCTREREGGGHDEEHSDPESAAAGRSVLG